MYLDFSLDTVFKLQLPC